MHEFVEVLDAVGKGYRSQARAIDGAVVVENFAAEVGDDFVVHRLAGAHEIVRDTICLDDMSAVALKHFADRGFAGGDPTGKSNF
jgi:hypothetical protein